MTTQVETAIYRLRVEGEEQIRRLTESIEGMDTAQENADKSNRNLTAQIQRSLTAMDPVLKAQKEYSKALELNARARESGAASESQLDAHMAGITAAYQRATRASTDHANATKANRYELINLGRQAQDVAVSLAGGQSPLTVLMQQGSQIADVFASSERKMGDIFKSIGSGIVSFVTNPITLGIAAVAGLTAAVGVLATRWAAARQEMERGLIGAGRDTSMADLKQFQESNAAGGGLSIAEARGGGIGLAKTGQIDINQLKGYEDAVRGFSILTGKDIPESMEALQKALTGGAAGVDELNRTYMVFDATARKNIATLAESTDQTRAANAMIDAMAEANRKATATLSDFEAHWTTISNFFANFGQTAVQTREEIISLKQAQLEYLESLRGGFFGSLLLDAASQTEKLRAELAALKAQAIDTSAGMKQLSVEADNYTRSLIPQIAQIEKLQAELKLLKEAQAAGVGGPDTAAAITIGQNKLRQLTESKTELIETAKATERLEKASASAGKINKDAMGTVVESFESATGAAKEFVENVDIGGGATARLGQHIHKANGALSESVSLTGQMVDAMGNVVGLAAQLPDALGQFGLSGGTLASAMQYATPNAQATPQDLSHSAFETQIMPSGPLSFYADPGHPVTYGQGRGRDLGNAGTIAYVQRMLDEQKATEDLKNEPVEELTSSIDDLKTSTDDLNRTNQELLSPYYTQDPRTSHIGFRSQGMASGGYVDVPGSYSANDNMLAMVPVASGERIYVDPMAGRRGTAGGGMTVNISSPITINGNANADQFGRTLYQSNQVLAKQVRLATQ